MLSAVLPTRRFASAVNMVEELPLSTGRPQRPQPMASVMPVAAVYQATAPIEKLLLNARGPQRPQPMASVVPAAAPTASMAAVHQVPQTPMPQTPMPQTPMTVKCSCPACINAVAVFRVSSEADLESVDWTKKYKKIVGRNDLYVVTCKDPGCMERFYSKADCVTGPQWWNTKLLHQSGSKGHKYFWCKEHE